MSFAPPPHSATANTSRPRVIVHERQGLWAARLRPRLPVQIPLRQTRSPAECLAELNLAPASFLVLETSPANLEGVLDILAQVRRHRWARSAAVAERQHAALEWLLREAGAVHFCTSPRRAGEIAALIARHTEFVPQPPIGLRAQVWESLPWPEAATQAGDLHR
jgi:hypothetical protein